VAQPSRKGASTSVSRIIKALRKSVYQAFLDPTSVAVWLAPDNMKTHIYSFDARKDGAFRISLTYIDPQHSLPGKTSDDTDTFQGRFAELIPDTKIVEVVEFESPDPAFAGEMKMTVTLAEATGGTNVTILCENIPKGIRPEDNEQGCKESLQKLAKLLE
jgi:uncharacterized protein YndB with AHSA1/START domain